MSKYEDIVNLALRRGIFFPSSEIYSSSPAGFYDFGPYGTAIRQNIIELWRKELVRKEDMLEIYGAQLMPESVFKSSGHLKNFNDPITRCKKCNAMHRVDNLISEITKKHVPEATPDKKLTELLRKNKIKCSKCKGDLGEVKRFNMMIKADVGISKKETIYLRPETCQSIFLDFARLSRTMRMKLPKGIAQVGRSFRNEISPRQTLLRQIEFTQMEIEVFFNPGRINEVENFGGIKDYKIIVLREGKKNSEAIPAKELVSKKIVSGKLIAYYLARVQQLYEKYGFSSKQMRFREVGKDERAFYAKETWDFEINTSLGWLELIANNYRTDYDLKGHMQGSSQDLRFTEEDGNKLIPHVWEISTGLDRTFYAILENAYKEEEKKGEKRILLSLKPNLSPLHAAIFPLLSNKEELVKKAKEVEKSLKESFHVFYDSSGSIGKRYARMDEIGVYGAITIDFDTLKDGTVTLRSRDTTQQIRVKTSELKSILNRFLNGEKLEELGEIAK